MDNLKSPAAPYVDYPCKDFEDRDNHYGFTKLELASLMIAQGFVTDQSNPLNDDLAKLAVAFAKAVLEECNK